MAHMIETFTDGSAAFFSNREPAWHKLGTVTDGAQTADDALRLAKLDWTVRKSDMPVGVPVIEDGGVSMLTLDDKFMTYREHPELGTQALGVVGSVYEPFQNSDAFAFLSNVVDESGAIFETAGSLDGGRRVFMTVKMPDHMQIGGSDAVDSYLLAWNSHDGSTPFGVAHTNVRVVCQNTLSWALQGASNRATFRHTATIGGRVHQAREALSLTFKADKLFQEAADRLIATPMPRVEFKNFVTDTLLPVPKDATEKIALNTEVKQSQIISLFDAPTQESIAGTRWAAYNAVTEWESWAMPTRSTDNDGSVRARRTIIQATEGTGGDLSRKAFKHLVNA